MKRCLGIVASACLLAAAAHAVEFEAGPHLGYTFGGDVEEASLVYGIQASAQFNEQWSLELALSSFTDESKETETWDGGAGGAVWMVDYDIMPIAATLRYHWTLSESLSAFVGAGAAWYILDAEGSAESRAGTTDAALSVDAKSGYGAHAVGGLNLAIGEQIMLFADLRLAIAGFDYEATYSGRDGGPLWSVTEDDTEDYTHAIARIGANYRF